MGGLVQQPAAPKPIGNIPPAEAEERYYAILEKPAMAA
jgi:putative transposase